jgi:hypothetical protein
MPTISSCPRCQRLVSLPDGVDSAATVRCPLCSAEYPLSEACPPELIPVEGLATTEPAGLPAAYHPDEESPGQEPENEAAAVAVRMGATAALARKRPPKPWWQTPVEIVTGGLLGCLLAYYGLALWLGPQFNLPKFAFLPFIAQLTAPAEKEASSGDKPASDKSAKAKTVGSKKADSKASDSPKDPAKESAKEPAKESAKDKPKSPSGSK